MTTTSELTFLGDVWLPETFRCDAKLPGDLVFTLDTP